MMDDKNTCDNGGFMAVVFGTLVGFAAGAATMFLMEDKNRKQVVKTSQKVFKNIKDKVADYSDVVEEKIDENKEKLSDKLNDTAKNLRTSSK